MDTDIIKMLEVYNQLYNKELANIEKHSDIDCLDKIETEFYLNPIEKFVIPFLKIRLFQDQEKIENYLPLINEHCHDKVIDLLQKREMLKSQDVCSEIAKEIVKIYSETVNDFSSATKEEKNQYIEDFCHLYEIPLEKIARITPVLAISVISQLNTPALQLALIRNAQISYSIKNEILTKLIKKNWKTWVEDYFTYPKTDSMDDYMNQWTSNNKIHIKHAKILFDHHYEEVKIWLKTREKNRI